MRKRLVKGMALGIMLSLLISGNYYGSAFAGNAEDTYITGGANVSSENISILQEVVSQRGEYEKHFLMSDGSYAAVIYNEPVHHQVQGSWVEIDNTLELKTDETGIEQYKTVDGLTDVSFAKRYQSQNELVTIRQGNYSVSWGLEAVLGPTVGLIEAAEENMMAEARVVSPDLSQISEEEQKTMAVKSSSAIRYADALASNVDLEYVVLSSRVKESIILESPQEIAFYAMNVYTENLSARVLENRQIEFFDADGSTVFTMWAPYMYDSAGELSENIAVNLMGLGENHYLVTITPDAEWLRDSDRVYPVVIDPDISPSRARTNIIDNYVLEGSGNQNANLDRMYIGLRSGKIARSYIKYDTMPTLPSQATITGAVQKLFITSGTSTANTANAYQVTGADWTSGTITWANKPAANTTIATNISHNNMSYYSFSCKSTVQSWYSGSPTGKNANYGIMVRYSNETINDYNAFYSADCSTESQRPLLTIYYTAPAGEICWPVPGSYGITSKWGYRNFSQNIHHGIDIECNEKEVVAAISGSVDWFENDSAGKALVVTKANSDFQTRYYHLKSYIVSSGNVTAGTPIATSGNTGESTGPHLHFQLQWGRDKEKSYNPLETYHQHDVRWGWTNDNPMFIHEGEAYVPNNSFIYTYTASVFNDTTNDGRWNRSLQENQ